MGAGPDRDATSGRRAVATLPLEAHLAGRLLRRYKRFFADVETPDGRVLTVHCPDPGNMRGLLREGAAVRCSTSSNPRRKLRHTLEMIRCGRVWVGVNPLRANALAERALRAGLLPGLSSYANIQREVRVGERTRLDFRLSEHPRDRRPCWLEVKSVTLALPPLARFPDSVTERGRRHAELLARLVDSGTRAALLFLVQRADCERVAPADDIDPAYGRALRAAVQRGVEVYALSARVRANGIRVERTLPVTL